MNALHHSPLATSNQATIMETIMKPLSFARRAARWLMAAGLALAAMQTVPARRSRRRTAAHEASTSTRAARPHPERRRGRAVLHQDRQAARLRLRRLPAALRRPWRSVEVPRSGLHRRTEGVRLDFRDTLPAGLEIVDVQVSGDGTDAVGGPLPAATISHRHQPQRHGDDRRLPAVDQPISTASGEFDDRYVDIVITAKIDHAAFPAPTMVDNQGFVTVTRPRRRRRSRCPRTIRRCRTTAISRPASRPRS